MSITNSVKNLLILFVVLSSLSCRDSEGMDTSGILADYLALHTSLEQGDIIACAGGKVGGLFGIEEEPTSVFFLPIDSASDFRYYEAEEVSDSLDFSKYIRKKLNSVPIFNGYLRKFNNSPFLGERMGIVTFLSPGKIHICSPIRLKPNIKPTEINPDLAEIISNGVNPTFNWEDGFIKENVIYFQVISDLSENLISGTYTYEKEFTFYDESNVVLNITDPDSNPVLDPMQTYKFTMMGVSEDNWVNLFIEKEFMTN